jgi:tRNA threonylcarbamoyladenosine biosynthesis protein TsaB
MLAIETTLGACSVALTHNNQVVFFAASDEKNTQAEILFDLIEQGLKEHTASMDDLSSIACCIGPGSFTGTRIGIAAAKGIALTKQLPIHPVSTLELLAYKAAKIHTAKKLAVVQNAMRGEAYFQLFDVANGAPTHASKPQLLKTDDIKAHTPENYQVVGDHADFAAPPLVEPDARALSEYVLRLEVPATRSSQVTPLYIRKPDAKLPAKS